ncbi:hypothetical protein P7C71_g5424, partial [Lecanoromycetidae sp. Uapishka_2]
MASDTTWQSLGQSKFSSINKSIPVKWRLSSVPSIEEQRDVTGAFIQESLSKEEIEVTETDAVGIVEKTHAGIWTAENVTTAFCHRASLAHQLTNCLHETFFDAAIDDAKRLDKYYAQHGGPIGPLHGLPISLKDQFHVKGVETTMGYIGWIGTFMAASSKLAFGIMKHDGIITPHPPVQRAMDIAVKTLESQGHKCIEWKPPAHKRGQDIIIKAYTYDGGEDLHGALGLAGEPMSAQVQNLYGSKPTGQKNASEISANNVAKREYQKEYMEYWNSTKDLIATGRPVDAFIMPLAPFAAARPTKYTYLGYSSVINTLDYTSCTIPVTTVDKDVDLIDERFQPVSGQDKRIAADYDPEIYDGAYVAIQLVGRRLQEERVLAMAEYLGSVIAASQ